MNIIKKALAGVAALGIAVSGLAFGAASATAADGDGTNADTGSITINKSKDDQVDHTFDGWHLASLTNITKDADGNINGFLIDTDDAMVGTIVSAMTGDQKSEYEKDANYYNTDDTKANPMGYLVDHVFKDQSGAALSELASPWGGDSSPLRAFAKSLSEKLAADGAPAATSTTLKTGTNDGLAQGLWFLKDTTTENDVKGANSIPIITPTTFAGADAWGTVTLKNTTPSIDKQLVDSNANAGYTPNTQPDYAVGDTVTYELSSTIPVYTGYDIDPTMQDTQKTRVFKITDTASKALTVSADSVIESVKLTPADGSAAVTLNVDKDYDVTVADYGNDQTPDTDAYKGGHVTTIDLKKYVNMADGSTSKTAGKILEGATVTVIVKTTLNKSALLSEPGNVQGNPNKVDLTYSNKPENVSDAHKVPGPEVKVYAYKFGIHKTDKAGTTVLPGAKFTIKAVSGTTNHDGQYLGSYGENGWSYVGATEPAADATTGVFVTDKDGNIAVEGLDAGVYEVHEIAPPAGYTSLGLPTFQFTITPTVGDEASGHNTITEEQFAITKTSDYVKINDQNGTQLDVWNAKNITELPKTGGVGLAMIVAAGVLCLGAAALFGLRARRNA
ncbi:SpaA isopeptide-forming pilin-related protein [Bifidobacterium leontopitheci]|uniref:Collagen-binding protein n=1 Tax=Bifidobacterium leontopitheci TaxID=2650774 RepID=A0A6I1GH24_9BIFI|nr:SpaA isopeptide-forming pilin-related protein [Bifidobacterium leontopitheci]KAB7788976.1 collagen-binding protein [Bifidobacterium leontopitheci]